LCDEGIIPISAQGLSQALHLNVELC
jgi:hypothetical protein